MNITSVKIYLAQMVFTFMSHRFYDFALYNYITKYLWGCPKVLLLDNYVENVSANHLEIGVGSGYFLENTLCEDYVRRLMLLDLNQRCLAKSADRLKEYAPTTRQHNMLAPLNLDDHTFDSIGMNYVLHCIPGSFNEHKIIFDNAYKHLTAGGVLFGATLVTQPLSQNAGSWLFMKLLNVVGVFNNGQQTEFELRAVLHTVFRHVEVNRVGNALLFRGVR